MSPEQFAGQQVDNRSDLFSTGVILYHLLSGEKPFPGNSMTTIMHRVMNTDPPMVSDLNLQVPSFLDGVVAKALAKKPDQRFQTAEEFKSALTKGSIDSSNEAAVDLNSDATVMISGSTDPTANLTSDEMTIATRQADATGNHVELQQKFDKIVGMLESQGVGTKETEQKLYERVRKLVVTILVMIILAISGYTVWIIYSEDLTYEELEQIAKDKVKDISVLFFDQNTNVVEISQSLKSKPSKEFKESFDPREGAEKTNRQPETTLSEDNSNKQEKKSRQAATPVPIKVAGNPETMSTETAASPSVTEKNIPPSPQQTITQKDLTPEKVLKEGAKETDIQPETTSSMNNNNKQGKEIRRATTSLPKTTAAETAKSPSITESNGPPPPEQIVTQKSLAPGKSFKEQK